MAALRVIATDPQGNSTVNLFQKYFDVDFAVSQEQKNAVFGLRYRVYCEERKHEPAHRFPNRMEHDEFDDKSLHCLITHKSSGIHAGCVRLVGTGGRRETDVLPFEKHCPGSVAPDFFRAQNLQREFICEISRLAVDRRFRRRPGAQEPLAGKAAQGAPVFSDEEVRTFPLIATAGFLAATALTEITGRTDAFAMMESYLPRLLRRAGFIFHRAGENVEYHGTRAAYFIKTEWAINKLRPELRGLYKAIHARIDQSYRVMDGWPFSNGYGTAGRGGHLRVVGVGHRR
ncbi:MAG: PEP-CTERM/exosortase system-associated acyltransferase [Gammaproteobacteria bacterium]|nr:PEP-CTERM/exosortase system-associated acyltransferase [Gammaproteobacteria bacterium]